MKEVFEEALCLMEKGVPFIVATIVHTRGSTPQKAGAKLLIRQDGSRVGNLGGGCIEGEIWSLATQILHNQSGPLYRRYDLKEEYSSGDGLVCGGTMHFFLEPVKSPGYFKSSATEIMRAYHGGPSVVIATVVNSPDEKLGLGAKILIKNDAIVQGSFGNSELDREIINAGKSISVNGGNLYYKRTDGIEIFIECISSYPILVLMGGGYVNRAVYKLAETLGFRIYVIDDRPEFANREQFPGAEILVVSDYRECLDKIPVDSNTYIVVATRGHRYDDMALAAAVRTQACYVGLLGSKRKTLEIYKYLLNEKVPPERLGKVRAPIGLNIGATSPEEIAVSIMAEIIMTRKGGSGMPMKMKQDAFLLGQNK